MTQKLPTHKSKPYRQPRKTIIYVKNMGVSWHTYVKVANSIISFPTKSLSLYKVDTIIDAMISSNKTHSKIYKLIKYNKSIANLIYNQ